ncbi:MAG: CAP domain-containing protein [Myxococcales bacterium]|nr:CAP domain-containing protein [Myxococcales bacterium]
MAGSDELLELAASTDPSQIPGALLPLLYPPLAAALHELVLTAPLYGYGVALRRGPAGVVAALVALPPPRLPLQVERHGQRAVVTARWNHPVAPAAFLVTPRRSLRLASQRVGDEVRVEVPCHSQLADLEVSNGGGMFVSVVDICNQAEPRWSASTGDIGPSAATLVEIEQRSFELLNRERRRHGLLPISWDATAQTMARWHALDLARHELVSHVGSDGNTLEQRVARAALPAWRTFENVGRAGGPGQMHLGFMTSPGHRDNLLEPRARLGAIGASRSASGELYLTQVLYQPRPMRRL